MIMLTQNYLVFQPIYKYFITPTNNMVMVWKFTWWSNESINPPATSDNSLNSLNPRLDILIILNFEYNSMEVVLNDKAIFMHYL